MNNVKEISYPNFFEEKEFLRVKELLLLIPLSFKSQKKYPWGWNQSKFAAPQENALRIVFIDSLVSTTAAQMTGMHWRRTTDVIHKISIAIPYLDVDGPVAASSSPVKADLPGYYTLAHWSSGDSIASTQFETIENILVSCILLVH